MSLEIIDTDEDFFITDVVILEVAHALETSYGATRPDVVDALSRFIRKANIQVHRIGKAFVLQGLDLCRPSRRVSIGDALIWAAAQSDGNATIYTFDRRFPSRGVTVKQKR